MSQNKAKFRIGDKVFECNSREEAFEHVLNLIRFELGSMPPFPGVGLPFGVAQSLSIINSVLNENPKTTNPSQ